MADEQGIALGRVCRKASAALFSSGSGPDLYWRALFFDEKRPVPPPKGNGPTARHGRLVFNKDDSSAEAFSAGGIGQRNFEPPVDAARTGRQGRFQG